MEEKTRLTPMKNIQKRALLLLLALMNLAGIATTLCVLLWLLLRETWSITALLSALMPSIFLPSCVFLVMSILVRGWRSAALNLLPVVVFLSMYGVYLLPCSQVVAEGQEITFLTFNLHTDPNANAAQEALIREVNADVVALQEVSEDTENYFRTALIDVYPYQVIYTNGMSVLGRGVLSRYPLSNDDLLSSGGREIALRVDVTANDDTFTVYNVHLATPDWGGIITYNADYRSANARDLLAMAAQETKPLVMLGDFNASDASNDYLAMAAKYGEACRERCQGLAVTFPATEKYPFPANLFPSLIRLDYIFYDARWQGLSAEVWHSSGGSDHRPLKASLALKSS